MNMQTSWWGGTDRHRGLRLATGLAHTIPGATALLRCAGGDQLLVAHDRPDAAMTPCDLRQLVIGSGMAGRFDVARHVTSWTIGGRLRHLGAGIHAGADRSGARRWFAVALSPATIVSLIDDRPDRLPEDGVDVTIKPDEALGVSVVAVTAPVAADLDEVAFWLASACMVEELLLPGGPPPLRR